MKSRSITTQIARCFLAAAICCLLGIIVSGQNKAEEKAKNKDFCQNAKNIRLETGLCGLLPLTYC